jgi:hypothetical protein
MIWTALILDWFVDVMLGYGRLLVASWKRHTCSWITEI